MKNFRSAVFFICVVCVSFRLTAQNCNCTVSEVNNNSVVPCTMTIGVIDTVTTAADLRLSIIETNNSGGDRTILIADGTYAIASTLWYPYLTASNVIIRSLSGNRDNVILTGTGMHSVSPGVEIGIFAVGDNITIADLTIKDVGNHGIAATGEKLFVHNVRIQNTFEQMIKGTSGSGGADDAVVQCSLFEYPNGEGPQFYIGGLDIHNGDNWIVRDNIFRNIASPAGSLAEHAIHFWNSSSNNLVERNMIINCDRGIGFGLGSSPGEGGVIRNNMIYNDGSAPFDDVGIGLETSPKTKVYNNTIFIDYPNAIEFRFDATTDVDIVNNLCNQQIRSRDGAQATLNTNITNAQIDWFEDLPSGNLRLISPIPTVTDQGTSLSEVFNDIDQLARPQSIAHDIGAHEFEMTTTIIGLSQNAVDVKLFPNPASDFFTLKSDKQIIWELSVFNGIGQRICSYQRLNLTEGIEIRTEGWQRGMYYCQLIDGTDKHQFFPLVIE